MSLYRTKTEHIILNIVTTFRPHEEALTGRCFIYTDWEDVELYDSFCLLWISPAITDKTRPKKKKICILTATISTAVEFWAPLHLNFKL